MREIDQDAVPIHLANQLPTQIGEPLVRTLWAPAVLIVGQVHRPDEEHALAFHVLDSGEIIAQRMGAFNAVKD